MNDEGALHRRPRHQLSRRSEGTTVRGRSEPRLVVEIPFEARGRVQIVADSFEDELRMRRWLRQALGRRGSLTTAIATWLDELDETDQRAA